MRFILFGIPVCILLVFICPGYSPAEERVNRRRLYMGTSYHYASETNAVFKHSDTVDYGCRQFGLFAGKVLRDLWRVESELIIARVTEENRTKFKDELLYGLQAALLYDFARIRRFSFYAGLSFGLGYLNRSSGYDALGDKNPFGLIAGKVGAEYYLSIRYFLRAQAGIWHISSAPTGDQGQNNLDYSLQFGYRF